MRRFLAILLLAAFALPVVAPLLAFGEDTEANLPICCRRNGAHHCMGIPEQGSPSISALCPSYPQQSAIVPHLTLTSSIAPKLLIKLPLATLTAPARAETRHRFSLDRSRHERGPPAILLAI